jgi:NADPH2:quinone reductase
LPYPAILGVEGGGIVEEVGSGSVGSVKVGDSVVYFDVGSYSQQKVLPAWKAVPVPDGVPLRLAVAVLVQGLTAHYLACSTYALKERDTCLVHAAAGGTGQLLSQVAKIRGATVIGTVSSDAKAAIAKGRGGCDHVVDYSDGPFAEEVRFMIDELAEEWF